MENIFKDNLSPKIQPFLIGNVKIHNPLVLAPMAGITDTIFRRIAKKMGVGLVYTEMISCNALYRNNKKTLKIAEFSTEELPIAAQIFGSDPYLMSEAAKKLESLNFSIIDINLGCSAPRILKSGAGAALCRDLNSTRQVLEAVVKAVKIPVTIKIRIGWSRQEITAYEVCRIAGEVGIAAIAIHARTSSQKYSGKADWQFIKKLQESTPLPIIGNGDISTPRQVIEALQFAGCSGIMIGRRAVFNPWIFQEALSLFAEKPIRTKPSIEDINDLILYHLRHLIKREGEEMGVKKIRKFIAWYTKSLPYSSKLRELVFRTNTNPAIIALLKEYFEKLQTIQKT